MAFVKFTKDEFEALLGPEAALASVSGAQELVYDFPSVKKGVNIRVYSTVDKRTGETRDKGADAIRIVYWDALNQRPLGRGRKVLRVEGATTVGERIKERIQAFQSGEIPNVVDYGYVKAILKASNGRFAESLSDSLEKYGRLTDGQLAYVLGQETPKGFATMEAALLRRNPNFASEWVNEAADDGDQGPDEIGDADAVQEERRVVAPKVAPTPGDSVELIPTESYESWKYPFPYFNPVQSLVYPYRDLDRNMVIGANTSAGKTICAELLIDAAIESGQKVIYLSPLKALTQEKYDDWSKRYASRNIVIMTGDYSMTAQRAKEVGEAHIIVMTSEMMDSRTRKMKAEKNWWLNEVGLVVVDEAHILTTERGHPVEAGIMRFTALNPKARILFLSATMPNVHELGEWLTALNGKECDVVFCNWRPVELNFHFLEYEAPTNAWGHSDYWETQRVKREAAVEAVLAKPEEKFLVFVHDKGTGRALVKMLNAANVPAQFHNAELGLKERMDIEGAFQNRSGGLRCIVSTSTLAWGRNLPARNVVIVGVHRGISEVDELDIVQMAGRAGRYGIDDEGHVHLIIPKGSTKTWVEIFKNPRPVISVLKSHETLAFHVLAEIETGIVKTRSGMWPWYRRSLAYRQKSLTPFTEADADALMRDLIEMEMVAEVGAALQVTGLGRVSSWMYFSPYDVFAWYKNFKRLFGSEGEPVAQDNATIAWALATLPSRASYVPKQYESDVEDWARALNARGINPGEAPVGTRLASLATYNCLEGEAGDGLLGSLMRSIRFDIDRSAQALSMIDGFHAKWHKEDFWKTLALRIKHGVPEEMVGLIQLPGIGAKRAFALWNKGVRTVEDVANPANKRKMAEVLGMKTVNQIIQAANRANEVNEVPF